MLTKGVLLCLTNRVFFKCIYCPLSQSHSAPCILFAMLDACYWTCISAIPPYASTGGILYAKCGAKLHYAHFNGSPRHKNISHLHKLLCSLLFTRSLFLFQPFSVLKRVRNYINALPSSVGLEICARIFVLPTKCLVRRNEQNAFIECGNFWFLPSTWPRNGK